MAPACTKPAPQSSWRHQIWPPQRRLCRPVRHAPGALQHGRPSGLAAAACVGAGLSRSRTPNRTPTPRPRRQESLQLLAIPRAAAARRPRSQGVALQVVAPPLLHRQLQLLAAGALRVGGVSLRLAALLAARRRWPSSAGIREGAAAFKPAFSAFCAQGGDQRCRAELGTAARSLAIGAQVQLWGLTSFSAASYACLWGTLAAVSYTHLTLPTKRIV